MKHLAVWPLPQRRQQPPRQRARPEHIGPERTAHDRLGPAGLADCRIVHEQVDAAEGLLTVRAEGLDRPPALHVQLHCLDAHAFGSGERGSGSRTELLVSRRKDNVRARLSETLRQGQAEATVGPGDDGHARWPEHVVRPTARTRVSARPRR